MAEDVLSEALSKIMNAEKIGKAKVTVNVISKVLLRALEIMKDNGYIGGFTIIETSKGKSAEINLIGKINKCGVIKPRFSFTADNIEKFEKRYLPAKNFGVIIVTSNLGITDHRILVEKSIGGKLLAYCY